MATKEDIAIIGGGGLGSNLAVILAEQGHDILLIDDDTVDQKFIDRFLFFEEPKNFYLNRPKAAAIQQVARRRNLPIECVHARVNSKFKTDRLEGRLCLIAVDVASVRRSIEALLKNKGLKYQHIGCNLGSISIFPTMDCVLADDPPADAESSYNEVPDAKTYMMACVKMIEWLDGHPIRLDIEDRDPMEYLTPEMRNAINVNMEAVTAHASELDRLIEEEQVGEHVPEIDVLFGGAEA